MPINKANRIALLDEGSFLGFARALDVVGINIAGSISGDVGTLTYTGREVLTAARTYYVRTDGSDSNTGLANTSGAAFATLAKAIAVTAALDLSTFGVTIQLGNTGSYAGFTVSAPFVGGPGSSVLVLGDTAAAGSYSITSTINVSGGGRIALSGVKLVPSSGDGLFVTDGATATIFGACQFGAASGARQIVASSKAYVLFSAACTINGGAANWLLAVENSIITSNGFVHTFSGTPAFSTATVQSQTGAIITIVNGTPSGAATGKRYDVASNSVVFTNGGGASFIPGNVAGGTASGGQYL